MALTPFATPLTAAPLDNLIISNNNGVGYSFADPGTYSLMCSVPWYYHASDSQAIADMTAVDAGETVTVTVTTSTATKYCKTAIRGEFALRIDYDAPTPQGYDADLAAIGALTSAADKMPYSTGAQTWALADLTAAGRAILDDAAAVNQRTTLGLAIGTNVQAWSANLDEYAAVNPTAAGLALLDDAAASNQRTTLGATAVGDAVFIATDAAAARTAIGAVIGTDVQAYDAELAALAGLTSAADKGIQFTGAGTAAVFDLITAPWTPTLLGLGTAGSPTYGAQTGSLTRTARGVLCDFRILLTGKGGMAGQVAIGSLPFTINASNYSAVSWGHFGGVTFGAGRTQLLGLGVAGTTQIYLSCGGSGVATAAIDAADITDVTELIGSFHITI